MTGLDNIEQLCKTALEDIQNCFGIKVDLWQEYVQKEIKSNEYLMNLINTRQGDFDWQKETPLGGAGTTLNAIILYCLIRHNKMRKVIETGISGGYYTTFMLFAMQENEKNEYGARLISLELSDDKEKVGKLIPQHFNFLKGKSDSRIWCPILGETSLKYFEDSDKLVEQFGPTSKQYPKQTSVHDANLYSHDSLHTMSHMMKELNHFKRAHNSHYYVFIDDEKSDNFWDKCVLMNAFKRTGYNVKYISGKESRLKGHMGGFIQYRQHFTTDIINR